MNITRDVGSGLKVGKAVVGDSVDLVGNSVGVNVGDLVGLLVGLNVRRGFLVGTLDGG